MNKVVQQQTLFFSVFILKSFVVICNSGTRAGQRVRKVKSELKESQRESESVRVLNTWDRVFVQNKAATLFYFTSIFLNHHEQMASKNFVQLAISRFDGHYDHWSMLMENFLWSKEYQNVVESSVTVPVVGVALTETQKTKLEGLKLKDLKAKNYFFQAIDRSILETILHNKTSKKIQDSMKKKFQGSTTEKRQAPSNTSFGV